MAVNWGTFKPTDNPRVFVNEMGEELYDANPDCKHKIVSASGGGIKCKLCSGWFCF